MCTLTLETVIPLARDERYYSKRAVLVYFRIASWAAAVEAAVHDAPVDDSDVVACDAARVPSRRHGDQRHMMLLVVMITMNAILAEFDIVLCTDPYGSPERRTLGRARGTLAVKSNGWLRSVLPGGHGSGFAVSGGAVVLVDRAGEEGDRGWIVEEHGGLEMYEHIFQKFLRNLGDWVVKMLERDTVGEHIDEETAERRAVRGILHDVLQSRFGDVDAGVIGGELGVHRIDDFVLEIVNVVFLAKTPQHAEPYPFASRFESWHRSSSNPPDQAMKVPRLVVREHEGLGLRFEKAVLDGVAEVRHFL